MLEKAKAFVVSKAIKVKKKAPVIGAACLVPFATSAVAFADDGSGGNAVLSELGSNSTTFLSVVSSIGQACMSNPICIAFLTVTFVSLGVRILRKMIGAFGRGR